MYQKCNYKQPHSPFTVPQQHATHFEIQLKYTMKTNVLQLT